MKRLAASLVSTLVIAIGLPESAWAHSVSSRFGELYGGILHPLTTLQHLVPWLGLGLLGGLLDTRTSRWVLIAFPAAVGVGTLLAGAFPELAVVSYFNLSSFVIIGVAVALALTFNTPMFVGFTALIGFSHGYANGNADLAGTAQVLYVIGVMVAGYLVIAMTTGVANALSSRTPWGGVAVRAAGSWIVAVGLVFGGFTLMQCPVR